MVGQTAKERADAHFKIREELKRDAPVARAEYDALAIAVREKTARLRLLRLARDASLPITKKGRQSPPQRSFFR